ncbi:MAG TPA: phage terminase large subunit [Flavobacterium alvei]|nr:phage terminase large subunit [Flavobacterium alvei]
MQKLILPTDDQINAELCRRSLAEFLKQAWHIIEPSEFISNWHIEVVAEHLEAVTRKQIQNLLINIPPRMMKSILTSVMWPAWTWIKEPQHRFMCATYAQTLSSRDAIKMRTVVESDWYKRLFKNHIQLRDDQNTVHKFENTKTGYRLSTSVGGVATGEGGDTLIIDDPHNADEIYSEALRNAAIDWWRTKMSSRLNNKKTGSKVIIMQRLHQNDLSGWILDESEEKFEHLILPMEYVPRETVSVIGFKDPRKVEGELLFPLRYGEKERDIDKKDMGSIGYSGQMQQDPMPAGGNIIKESDIKYFTQSTDWKKIEYDDQELGFDMSFEGDLNSDYNVGVHVTRLGTNYYVQSRIRGQWNFPVAMGHMRTFISAVHDRMMTKSGVTIEKKANGHAALQILSKEFSGVRSYEPEYSKEARLYEVQPLFEAGNVHFPEGQSWVSDCIKELLIFPKGKNDDFVDALVMTLIILKNRSTSGSGFVTVGKRKYG